MMNGHNNSQNTNSGDDVNNNEIYKEEISNEFNLLVHTPPRKSISNTKLSDKVNKEGDYISNTANNNQLQNLNPNSQIIISSSKKRINNIMLDKENINSQNNKDYNNNNNNNYASSKKSSSKDYIDLNLKIDKGGLKYKNIKRDERTELFKKTNNIANNTNDDAKTPGFDKYEEFDKLFSEVLDMVEESKRQGKY